MTVSTYLKDALTQIDQGLRSVKPEKDGYGFKLKKYGTIKFDLAVINKKDKRGNIKLEVFAFGGKGDAGVAEELTSRVQFEVEYSQVGDKIEVSISR